MLACISFFVCDCCESPEYGMLRVGPDLGGKLILKITFLFMRLSCSTVETTTAWARKI